MAPFCAAFFILHTSEFKIPLDPAARFIDAPKNAGTRPGDPSVPFWNLESEIPWRVRLPRILMVDRADLAVCTISADSRSWSSDIDAAN